MTDSKTSYLFFTVKGGVGKTSLACATAVEMADAGKVVLLVSADPASNLSDVLGSQVGAGIKPYAWLINQCLSMLAGITDPLLKSRAHAETKVIKEVRTSYAVWTYGIPFIAEKRLLPALLDLLWINSNISQKDTKANE